MRAALASVGVLCLGLVLGGTGCAAIWGFDDLSQGRDAGAQDSATRDAAVHDAMRDASAHDGR